MKKTKIRIGVKERIFGEEENNGLKFPKDIKLNPGGQQKIINRIYPEYVENKRLFLFLGGIGSGKSFLGACFILYRILQDHEQGFLISANTYGQIETSTLVAFCELCDRFSNVSLQPSGGSPKETARKIAFAHHCKVTIDKKTAYIFVLSSESFVSKSEKSVEAGRGMQIRTAWLDEYAYSSETAIETILGRLGRGKGDLKGLGLITTTINRNNPYNWIYEYFDNPKRTDARKDIFESVKVSTRENIHLDSDYITTLKASLTPELFAIEVESEYVAITKGRIFKYFNRNQHVVNEDICFLDLQYNLQISIDFNYSPTCAIASQFIDKEVYILKEWYLEDAGTFVLAEEIANWIKESKFKRLVEVFGDATGNQKTANSRRTNWQIVKDEFNTRKIKYATKYKKINPEVQDSINFCNRQFLDGVIFIEEKCDELIKDLEILQYNEKGQIDKKDIKRSHLADCFRYLIYGLFASSNSVTVSRRGIKGLTH